MKEYWVFSRAKRLGICEGSACVTACLFAESKGGGLSMCQSVFVQET
jgi:hypothetical protein